MSRVGSSPIPIPSGVQVAVRNGVFVAEGPKGKVEQELIDGFSVTIGDDEVTVARPGDSGPERSQHGLLRSLLANAVQGVAVGFTRELEINGVGFRVDVRGRAAHFSLGFSHPVVYPIPEGIEITLEEKGNRFKVQGADRQLVGQVAAEIRALRPPEPYKGKGIKYADEIVKRKVGKAGVATAK